MLAVYFAGALMLRQGAPALNRDAYGVAHIRANSLAEAFYDAGYAVAQDRLWQMETSRRLARAQMAEAFGASYAASDREILQTGYTGDELYAQLGHLSEEGRTAFREYARGVNAWIAQCGATGLPEQYAKYGLSPRPWTELDSAAIAVRMLQLFGRGGAGEIRNLALLSYLGNQPNSKNRALDILDDFAWFNDPQATTTVAPKDDLVKTRPEFYYPDRAATEHQLAAIPKLGLFELLQGVQVSQRTESTRLAQNVAAPFETGSYCVVVSPKRSATGHPLLLSGPQMGFRTPSIVHEMSIKTPDLDLVGMDIPGVPGIVIGYSPDVAWGMTSGVADTDDIFYYPTDATGYVADGQHHDFVTISRPLLVKGGATQTVTELRTADGPVVLRSANGHVAFAKKSSYWMRELESMEAFLGIWHSKRAVDVDRAIQRATMNFNLFYATSSGDVGYRYAGLTPLRAVGVDPRLPTPGDSRYRWRGLIPAVQMPHAMNPTSGFFANWNNKPADWWPNGDTPVWGRIFRNSDLVAGLQRARLNAQDLELAIWNIARMDETWPYFEPYILRAIHSISGTGGSVEGIAGFDGRMVDGSRQALVYQRFLVALRQELFIGTTGNFLSPQYFELIAQPSVMLRALEHRTKVDYLHGRSADDVVRKALVTALGSGGEPARFAADGIPVPNQPPIAYSNRGSFIQVLEWLKGGFRGRDVVTPGVAESGPHAFDQVDLARSWLYKPMSD